MPLQPYNPIEYVSILPRICCDLCTLGRAVSDFYIMVMIWSTMLLACIAALPMITAVSTMQNKSCQEDPFVEHLDSTSLICEGTGRGRRCMFTCKTGYTCSGLAVCENGRWGYEVSCAGEHSL